MFLRKFFWQDPLKLAQDLSLNSNYRENWLFLFSGLYKNIAGSKSYLALLPESEIIAQDFDELERQLKTSDATWYGYLAYDLKNKLEDLTEDQQFKINLPNLWLINFKVILEFDHEHKTLNCFLKNAENLKEIFAIFGEGWLQNLPTKASKALILGDKKNMENCIPEDAMQKNPKITALNSNFSKAEYLSKVENIKEKIANGDLYQANLTRKFFGKIQIQNKFELFLKLNQASPANYSSFLKLNENYIISSSPELFLQIAENGLVKSSPIKGTAPRFKDKNQDILSKENLQNSQKEQAENLMIVDLVRNDLSKSCEVNSVKVENLFQINSYKTVHHMSSDIIGLKKKNISNLEVIKNCFPPASMIGSPKIKAMEVCSTSEKIKRGIYSGSIGFISDKNCLLSVVIRTLIIKKNDFEFQVGGAITFDSDPLKEWEETVNKSKGIARALGLNLKKIRDL